METKLTIYTDFVKNKIDKNIYGHFMEHAFGTIYGGVYEPGHPKSDEDGFRTDVLEALRQIKVPVLRYPGGNFVSNYHWEDGIGEKEGRPRVFDYSWHSEESNQFGTIEFIKLCRKINAEPYLCCNMGTGTVEEAMHWVEFCNSSGDTKYANMRRNLGYNEPFHVRYWGLGNEMFGGWQMGFLSAEQYAQKAVEFGKAMKWVDPEIELIACGYELNSDWNYTVVQKTKRLISAISAHHYSAGWGIFNPDDYNQCLYIPDYLDKLTHLMHADIIAGANDSLTDIKVVWDEWNIKGWEMEKVNDDRSYTMQDAVLTAAVLHTFFRNSNIVSMANYSPFINISGALSVHEEGIVRRPQYMAFQLLSAHAGNRLLGTQTECEMHELEEMIDWTGRKPEPRFNLTEKEERRKVKTPFVDCIASVNGTGKLVISIINKHFDKGFWVKVQEFGSIVDWNTLKVKSICHDDIQACNTLENMDRVSIKEESDMVDSEQKAVFVRPHSVNLYEFKLRD